MAVNLVLLGITASILTSLGLLLLGWTLHILAQRRKYGHIPSPPLAGFWSGHANLMLDYRAKGKPPMDALALEWFQKLETDILVLFAYHVAFVVVCGPQKSKIILQSTVDPKPPELVKLVQYPFNERYTGGSIATTSHYQDWKPRRTLINKVFHKKNLKGFISTINDSVDTLLQRLQSKADEGCIFSLHKEFLNFALHVATNTIIGIPLDFIDQNSELTEGLAEIGDAIASIAINPLFKFCPWNWKFIGKCKGHIRQLREMLRRWVLEKREDIELQDGENIISTLLRETGQKSSITLDDIVDELVAFLLAGHETTGNAMAFLAMEIASHSNVEDKLVNEIDEILHGNSKVDSEDLPKFLYLNQVTKETIRLYTVILNTQRKASSDIYMEDLIIPRGTNIWVSLYSNSHHPAFWKKPNEFIPERFEDESKEGSSSIFTPFSSGPRNCIGQHLAKMEIKILIARLFQKFRFELEPNQHGKSIANLALTPYGGTMGRLTYRSKAATNELW